MLSTKIIITISALILLVGCSDRIAYVEVNAPVTIELGYGDGVTIDGGALSVAFIGEVSDNRCPADVQCFWPGNAGIELLVQSPGHSSSRLPLWMLGGGRDTISALNYIVDTLGYSFSLRALEPYPERADRPVADKDYTATVRIEAMDESDRSLLFTDQPVQEILLAEYEVDSAWLSEGDSLSLRLRYGGGCQKHAYRLFQVGGNYGVLGVANADLYVQHIDRNDACEAYIADVATFDLSTKRPREPLYAPAQQVVFHIFEYHDGTIREAASLVYEIPWD